MTTPSEPVMYIYPDPSEVGKFEFRRAIGPSGPLPLFSEILFLGVEKILSVGKTFRIKRMNVSNSVFASVHERPGRSRGTWDVFRGQDYSANSGIIMFSTLVVNTIVCFYKFLPQLSS